MKDHTSESRKNTGDSDVGKKSDTFKIIVGGVIGWYLKFISDSYFKKKDFRDAFYKKIIDKRIIAYEFTENYLFMLSNKYSINGIMIYNFLASLEKFNEIRLESNNCLKYRSRCSKELLAELKKFIIVLNNINEEIQPTTNSSLDIFKKYGNKIKDLTNNIGFIIYSDFYQLDKVDLFLKSKVAYKMDRKKLNKIIND